MVNLNCGLLNQQLNTSSDKFFVRNHIRWASWVSKHSAPVPSTITFDSRLNSFVQAKKIDLFFESDKYLFLSQVLIFSKYGFMVWVKLLMFGLGVGMVISCAYVVILMLLFSDSGI